MSQDYSGENSDLEPTSERPVNKSTRYTSFKGMSMKQILRKRKNTEEVEREREEPAKKSLQKKMFFVHKNESAKEKQFKEHSHL